MAGQFGRDNDLRGVFAGRADRYLKLLPLSAVLGLRPLMAKHAGEGGLIQLHEAEPVSLG